MSDFYNSIGNDRRLSIIAGPCVFENQELAVEIAETLKDICDDLSVNFCFKMSFSFCVFATFKEANG